MWESRDLRTDVSLKKTVLYKNRKEEILNKVTNTMGGLDHLSLFVPSIDIGLCHPLMHDAPWLLGVGKLSVYHLPIAYRTEPNDHRPPTDSTD